MEINLKEVYIKYKHVIWPVIISTSSIIILVFVIIPQLAAYLNIKNQITDIVARSSLLDAKAAELTNVDEVSTQEDLKVVFTVLPPDQDVLSAVAILQNLVTSSSLQLQNTNFSSSKQKTETDKGSFHLSLTVTGQINSLRDFLVKLQDTSRVFQIESISVQFLKNKLAVEAEIPITVFYQTVPKFFGPIDQKVPELSDSDRQLLSRLSNTVSQTVGFSQTVGGEVSVPLGKPDPFE